MNKIKELRKNIVALSSALSALTVSKTKEDAKLQLCIDKIKTCLVKKTSELMIEIDYSEGNEGN